MNETKIREAAVNFRNAIELCSASLGVAFNNFPKGSCGDTVLMLGTYLIDMNLGKFQYVLGNLGSHKNGTWKSHAWLQSNDLIVDITADQFDERTEKVIVGKETIWHKKLNGKPQHVADFRIFDLYTKARLENMYKKIINQIEIIKA